MKKEFIEIYGWYGTAAIMIAYALSSFSVIKSSDLIYQFLNLTGAWGIVILTFSKKAYQPGLLNVIWSLIALVAIIKIFFYSLS